MSIYPFSTEETVVSAARKGMSVAQFAIDTPDRVAIYSSWGNRSWHQLNSRANQLVRAIRVAGLGDGDSLAMMIGNRPEYLEVFMAALRGGFRLTPINWHLNADEVAYILEDCDARCFITEDRFADTAKMAMTSIPDLDICLMVSDKEQPELFQITEVTFVFIVSTLLAVLLQVVQIH